MGKALWQRRFLKDSAATLGKNVFYGTVTASLSFPHFLLLSFLEATLVQTPWIGLHLGPILIYGYKEACLWAHHVRLNRLCTAQFQGVPVTCSTMCGSPVFPWSPYMYEGKTPLQIYNHAEKYNMLGNSLNYLSSSPITYPLRTNDSPLFPNVRITL